MDMETMTTMTTTTTVIGSVIFIRAVDPKPLRVRTSSTRWRTGLRTVVNGEVAVVAADGTEELSAERETGVVLAGADDVTARDLSSRPAQQRDRAVDTVCYCFAGWSASWREMLLGTAD